MREVVYKDKIIPGNVGKAWKLRSVMKCRANCSNSYYASKLRPRVSYYSRKEKAERIENFVHVIQLERYDDLRMLVKRR